MMSVEKRIFSVSLHDGWGNVYTRIGIRNTVMQIPYPELMLIGY